MTCLERFPAQMDALVPWQRLIGALSPPYFPNSAAKPSCPPIDLERMLRLYFLQEWYVPANEAFEDTIYDSLVMRGFIGIDPAIETNIGRFIARHEHHLTHDFFEAVTRTVLANEHRVIVAYAVDVTSETRVMPSLLDQSDRVAPSQQRQLFLDTGYFTDSVIQQALVREIDLLCPPKKSTVNAACAPYHKNQFHYDEEADVYHCPAGERLHRISHTQKTARSREASLYSGAPCHACSHRQACTKVTYGRRIKHYPEDEARVALQHLMEHPKANEAFKGRKAMVEPVFASLREQQGLKRFRRRGLTGVIREFALHAMAYNLARAVAFYRLLQGSCMLFWCGILALLNPIVRRRKYTEFCAEMEGPKKLLRHPQSGGDISGQRDSAAGG